MIYLSDRGFRIKSALNILVNQYKYLGIYNECFCLGCNVNDNDNQGTCFADDKYNVNVNNNDNDKDLRNSFTKNDNDNDNDNDNGNDNDNDIDNDIDNDNDNDNDSVVDDNDNDNDNFINNDNVKDNVIYQFGEKHQKGKPNNNSPTNTIREAVQQSCFANSPIYVKINEDLQSWLNDDDIITEATFPDNFRCILSGPSECGETFLLKKTNSS